MNILLLNADRSSTLPLDELLLVWPDRYTLLCQVVGRGALPSLAGAIAERDTDAGRKFLVRLDQVVAKEQFQAKRDKCEQYRSPVLSALARTNAYEILGEIDD